MQEVRRAGRAAQWEMHSAWNATSRSPLDRGVRIGARMTKHSGLPYKWGICQDAVFLLKSEQSPSNQDKLITIVRTQNICSYTRIFNWEVGGRQHPYLQRCSWVNYTLFEVFHPGLAFDWKLDVQNLLKKWIPSIRTHTKTCLTFPFPKLPQKWASSQLDVVTIHLIGRCKVGCPIIILYYRGSKNIHCWVGAGLVVGEITS